MTIKKHKKSFALTPLACLIALAMSPLLKAQQQDANEDSIETIEVVLSAAKTKTTAFQTPSAVSTISPEQIALQQLTDMGDITKRQPGLYLTDFTGNSASATIRGLGFSDDESDSLSNSIYLDGIPIYGQALGQIFDLEQIEILRGPQSSLYGQSSQGGLIALRSRDPGFEPAGTIKFAAGSYNLQQIRLTGDIPLSDSTAVRVSAGGESADGYMENSTLNVDDSADWDSQYARIKLLHQGDDGEEFRLSFHHMKLDAGNDVFIATQDAKKRLSPSNEKGYTETEYSLISAEYIKPLTNQLELTTLVGANKTSWRYQLPASLFGGINGFITKDGKHDSLDTTQLSAEVRLASSQPDSDWLIAVYAGSHDKQAPYLYDASPYFLSETLADIDGSTAAIFGEYGWQLSSSVRLAGRLRYERNEKKMDWYGITAGLFDSDGDQIPDTPFSSTVTASDLKITDNEWLPQLVLEYAPEKHTYAWVKLARGYKASGFNQFTNALDVAKTPYQPEYGNYIEAGYRARGEDSLWQLETTVYHMDLTDQQVVSVDPQGRTLTNNAASSYSKGLEVTGWYRLTDDVKVDGFLALIDAKYEEYQYGEYDYAGAQFANTPSHNYGLSLDWTPDQNWQFYLSAVQQGSSTLFPDLTAKTPGYTLVDSNIHYQHGDWKFSLYANNLLDELYYTRALKQGYVVLGAPRTYGFSVAYSF